jgi:hypothetical protein
MDHGPWILKLVFLRAICYFYPFPAESWRLRQRLTRRNSIFVSFYEAMPTAMYAICLGTVEASVPYKESSEYTRSPMTLLITDSGHNFTLSNPTGSVSTHLVETGASSKLGYQPLHLVSPARMFESVLFKKCSFAELNQKK